MPPDPLPTDLRLFEWFDHNGWAYWTIGWGVFAFVLSAALLPLASEPPTGAAPVTARRPVWLRLLASNTVFALAIILVFSAFRWPLWFAGPLENPDEAQWIAGALTLRDGGLPWKSLDCHTSGPLNPATLLLTIPLGLPLDYVGARVLASLLQAAAVLALWGAARRLVPEWAARLAVLPAVNLWACRWFHDLGQYSSELTPVLLLALAGWTGAVALTTSCSHRRRTLLVAAGALTTLPFFAKPQALLLSATLGLLLVGAVWFAAPRNSAAVPSIRDRLWYSGALALGAALPVVIFFGYLAIYGLVAQVRIFFWQSNLLYTGVRGFALCDTPEVLFDLVDPIRGFTAAALGVLAFGLVALAPAFVTSQSARGRLLGAWLLVGVALLTVVSPGRTFQHYIQFLIVPLSWLAAVSLAGANDFLRNVRPTSRWQHSRILAIAFLLITTAWPVWQTQHGCPAMNGQLYFWRERQLGSVGVQLRALAVPGDKLVVWGWAPGLHVESGLGQGAREAHSERIINEGPLQNDYRHRFLFDLRRIRPRWFVDAVAPDQFGFQERSLFGHETWPELRELIAADYQQIAEIDQVRIYRRRD